MVTIYSLQEKNEENEKKLEKISDGRCIIYRDVNANPCRYILDALENSPTDLLLFVDDQEIISADLIDKGVETINKFPQINFVYSDGYLIGKYKQRLHLPIFKKNLLKNNKLVVNMPILVKRPFVLEFPPIQHLHLLFLFKKLCEQAIGYHLAKPTYQITNFKTDISEDLKYFTDKE